MKLLALSLIGTVLAFDCSKLTIGGKNWNIKPFFGKILSIELSAIKHGDISEDSTKLYYNACNKLEKIDGINIEDQCKPGSTFACKIVTNTKKSNARVTDAKDMATSVESPDITTEGDDLLLKYDRLHLKFHCNGALSDSKIQVESYKVDKDFESIVLKLEGPAGCSIGGSPSGANPQESTSFIGKFFSWIFWFFILYVFIGIAVNFIVHKGLYQINQNVDFPSYSQITKFG